MNQVLPNQNRLNVGRKAVINSLEQGLQVRGTDASCYPILRMNCLKARSPQDSFLHYRQAVPIACRELKASRKL